MELRKQGKIDEKVFAETRLRRGIYGQRYDNGQRHDGKLIQKLEYRADVLKGPDTFWDAPGMMRIKIPFGGVNARTIGDASGSLRRIRRRCFSRHHAPRLSISLCPHR